MRLTETHYTPSGSWSKDNIDEHTKLVIALRRLFVAVIVFGFIIVVTTAWQVTPKISHTIYQAGEISALYLGGY